MKKIYKTLNGNKKVFFIFVGVWILLGIWLIKTGIDYGLRSIPAMRLELSSEDLQRVMEYNAIDDWCKIKWHVGKYTKEIKIKSSEAGSKDFMLDIDGDMFNLFQLNEERMREYKFWELANIIGLETSAVQMVSLKINEVEMGKYLLEEVLDESIRDDKGNYYIRFSTDAHLTRKMLYFSNRGKANNLLEYFDQRHLAQYFSLCQAYPLDGQLDFQCLAFQYNASTGKLAPYVMLNADSINGNKTYALEQIFHNQYDRMKNLLLSSKRLKVLMEIEYENIEKHISAYQSRKKQNDGDMPKTIAVNHRPQDMDKKYLLNGKIDIVQESTLRINEIMASNGKTIRDSEKESKDWIEIYNCTNKPIALKGYGLSDDPKNPYLWTFPDVTIEAKGFLLIWASGKDKIDAVNQEYHTNFKITSQGEAIVLTDNNGNCVDEVVTQPMRKDVSVGRFHDGEETWLLFEDATPGKPNNTLGISHLGGFYREEFQLTMGTVDPDHQIYYTLDGSEPTEESKPYVTPLSMKSRIGDGNLLSEINGSVYFKPYSPKDEIFKTNILRARVYKDGKPVSPIYTHTYFVDENMISKYTVPVVSLITDPENLFDYEKGIYVPGKVFDDWAQKFPNQEITPGTPANYTQKGRIWERPGHMEFFDAQGNVGFSLNAGIRISGNWSRAVQQKPLRIFARKIYDEKNEIQYPIFLTPVSEHIRENEEKEYKSITLRNSGGDFYGTRFKDIMIQSLVQNLKVDTLDYRTVVVFLNGEYWGLYNMRERYDASYFKHHYGLEDTELAVLYYNNKIDIGSSGDDLHYQEMLQYMRENDIRNSAHYQYIKTKMDMENYIDYCVVQIYIGNHDWPGNNVRYWRKKTEEYRPQAAYGHDGRWRWVMWDTDSGFKDATRKTLEHATIANYPEGRGNGNPPWSTFLLSSLLKNEEFKKAFINRLADLLNTHFQTEKVIEHINLLQSKIAPEIPEHIARWGISGDSVEAWENHVQKLRDFAQNRPRYMIDNMLRYFDLEGTANITIDSTNYSGGIVKINTIQVKEEAYPWSGSYFQNIPITITAIPNEGYVFKGWEGYVSHSNTIEIRLTKDMALTARFTKK